MPADHRRQATRASRISAGDASRRRHEGGRRAPEPIGFLPEYPKPRDLSAEDYAEVTIAAKQAFPRL
jgi:hypothetical protein